MSPEVMGVEMDGNLRGWGNAQRRVGSLLALVVAAVLLVGALAVYFLMGSSGAAIYWTLVVLVVVALLFEVVLLAVKPTTAGAAWSPEPASETTSPQPAAPAESAWTPPPTTPAPEPVRTLTLRCSDCGTVFDISDTGERPLRHTCPGCGAEGTLRDEAMAPVPAPAEPAPAPTAAPQPVPPMIKRLKLRCGGCKEVFTIEDTGERPLRRPCPYCGRTGEVR